MMIRPDRPARWLKAATRIARAAAIGAAATTGAAALATVVLWDADFYALRDRFENMKIALFGEWTPSGADDRPIANVFRDMAHVAVFKEVPIEGTILSVVTGSRYISAADLLAGRASRLWCYINSGGDGVTTNIELGVQNRGERPVYASLGDFSSSDLPAPIREGASLERLARTHCRFAEISNP
jgi:hypothetical protein